MKRIAAVSFSLIIVAAAVCVVFRLLPGREYSGEDFGIETLISTSDYDGDGVDDYRDIMLGARADAENHPTYKSAYYDGGYPPEEEGVCTDVIWRAFKNAGYSLKDMVDSDIAENPEDYPAANTPDPNIYFRRVRNLRVFFEKYAERLTLDPSDISDWQPGDIIIFGSDKHIGIVSEIRNGRGHTYIIHNGGQKDREEDYFGRMEVTGHYRFDVSQIDTSVLRQWQ